MKKVQFVHAVRVFPGPDNEISNHNEISKIIVSNLIMIRGQYILLRGSP